MTLNRGQLLVAMVLAITASGAGYLVARYMAPPAAVEGLLWPNPRSVADFSAMDQDGQPFTAAHLRGRWSVLFFGFANCPDICPTTLAVLGQARTALAAAAGGIPLQVVFVSVDPGRDTPGILREYVRYFDPAFLGVGGPGVMGLVQQLGIPVAMGPVQPDASYSVDHSASLFVVDPQGRLVGVISAPHTADSVTARFSGIAGFIGKHGP